MPRLLIVAHRAMTPGATENSPRALALAARSGADLIELDIRLTLDRRPVVLHDAFIGGTTRGHGPVRLWPSFALDRLPLRHGHTADHVHSLRSMIEAFPDGVQPALHVKDRAALPAVLKMVAKHGQPGRTWLWLAHPADVYRATRTLPEIRVTLLRPAGWLPHAREAYFEEAQWVGASGVSVPWEVVDQGLTRHAHQHRLQVFSRLERMETLPTRLAAGLDGVITTDPEVVRRHLKAMTRHAPV